MSEPAGRRVLHAPCFLGLVEHMLAVLTAHSMAWRSVCSAKHYPALLLVIPMCFYVFAHLLIYSPHADKMSAQRLVCGQMGQATSLLGAIVCLRAHHIFSDGLLPVGAGCATTKNLASLPPARQPFPMVAWEATSSLLKPLLLLLIILFKNKKWNHCDFYHSLWCFSHQTEFPAAANAPVLVLLLQLLSKLLHVRNILFLSK